MKNEKLELLVKVFDLIDKEAEEKRKILEGEELIGFLEGIIVAKNKITDTMWDLVAK